MKHYYFVTFSDIELRPMSVEDSEKYRCLRNIDNNRKWFVYTDVISKEEQQIWYTNYLGRVNDFMFSAYCQNDFIGGCAIYNVDAKQHTAEFGRIIVDQKYKKKCGRYGAKIIIAALLIAKNDLCLSKIYLSVKKENIIAVKAYKKVGFNIAQDHDEEILSMEITI